MTVKDARLDAIRERLARENQTITGFGAYLKKGCKDKPTVCKEVDRVVELLIQLNALLALDGLEHGNADPLARLRKLLQDGDTPERFTV